MIKAKKIRDQRVGLTRASVAFLVYFISATDAPAQVDFEGLVRDSRFIFQGTVKQLNTSNISSLPISDNTSVVSVDRVFHTPGTLGDFTGTDVTVLLTTVPVEVGQQEIFITEVVLYAESVAVAEVGRIAVPEDTANLEKRIEDALASRVDHVLQERIESAELVVVGQVIATRVAPAEVRQGRVTEHYPDWWEAVIQVQSVEKGEHSDAAVVILFPNSQDVVWDRAPKFHEGQEGVWILRKGEERLGADQYLTALEPLDYHELDRSTRIRGLIKSEN